jgi:hypothetical protein
VSQPAPRPALTGTLHFEPTLIAIPLKIQKELWIEIVTKLVELDFV